MITINDYLPENEEEIKDFISCPIYERLNDYLLEEYSVETLYVKYESIRDMLIYATGIYLVISTKHCTNPNNRDILYIADELAMKAATEYIDEKVKEPLEMKEFDKISEEFLEKYRNASEEEREIMRLEQYGMQVF